MSSEASVSAWIVALRDHDEAAAQALYERYIQRLTSLARKKLGGMPRRISDEDDVAQIVMNSFFTGAANARFPMPNDRHDLWQVLVMLTERKVVDQMRRQFSR
jgi:DNA-directed RNA polymerase specialized sigma24 family protein